MPPKKLLISDFGEKKLINRIINRTNTYQNDYFSSHPQIQESLGDDAALMDFGSKYLVVTSDMLLEISHFPPQMTPRQIGWKIVTVNVSDLAAMGASPRGLIISMGLPKDMELEYFDELVEGLLQACNFYEIPLIGGDTNESPQMVLSGTALGELDKNQALMKSGAQVGDLLVVTGSLGMAAAGFEVLLSDIPREKIEDQINPQQIEKVVKHALSPHARLKEGIIAAESGFVVAATDITDGLVSELEELMNAVDRRKKQFEEGNKDIDGKIYPKESQKHARGMRIYEDKLPLPDEVLKIGAFFDKNPLEMALYYGEDFELLMVVKKESIKNLKEIMNVHVVGEVTDTGVMEIVNKQGKTNILPPGGYQHLGG